MIELFRYKLKYIDGFREGLVLKKADRFAEIAPHPLLSKESLDDCISAVARDDQSCFPSVAFAFFSLSQEIKPLSVPLSALFMGSFEQIIKQSQEAKIQGIKSAKIKIAALSDRECKELFHSLSKDFHLRIDVNGKKSVSEMEKLLKNIPIEYVEDPILDKDPTFALAIDTYKQKTSHPFYRVIKPTLLGPLKELPANAVLSSSFESSLGLLQIAHFGKIKGINTPYGIGTGIYFKEDLIKTKIENGRLCFLETAPDFSFLEKIPL